VYPDEIALTPELKPVTAVGVSLVVFVPSPSSLKLLYPQHLAAPVLKSAQVCIWLPAEIAMTPELKPVTAVAVSLSVFAP
jgi:hypothetical protein